MEINNKSMKKYIEISLLAFLCFFSSASLVSCEDDKNDEDTEQRGDENNSNGDSPSVVGTWTQSFSEDGTTVKLTLTFSGNGKHTLNVSSKQSASASGTWSYNSSTHKLHVSHTFSGSSNSENADYSVTFDNNSTMSLTGGHDLEGTWKRK